MSQLPSKPPKNICSLPFWSGPKNGWSKKQGDTPIYGRLKRENEVSKLMFQSLLDLHGFETIIQISESNPSFFSTNPLDHDDFRFSHMMVSICFNPSDAPKPWVFQSPRVPVPPLFHQQKGPRTGRGSRFLLGKQWKLRWKNQMDSNGGYEWVWYDWKKWNDSLIEIFKVLAALGFALEGKNPCSHPTEQSAKEKMVCTFACIFSVISGNET